MNMVRELNGMETLEIYDDNFEYVFRGHKYRFEERKCYEVLEQDRW